MQRTNKKVSMNVIHVLKSIVDYKVGKLRTDVDAGERAKQEEHLVCGYISSLQQFINNSRYDRNDAVEAEQELAEYEMQASAIRAKINRGNIAIEQLSHAQKFDTLYKNTCRAIENAPILHELESERATLESRLTSLERNMESCEINMTPNVYNGDIERHSRHDYECYAQEYDRTYERLQRVTQHINSLQK